MVDTPFGCFYIIFEKKQLDYKFNELSNTFGSFSAEKRVDIFIDKFEKVSFKFGKSSFQESLDSDESFTVKIIENDKYILGIGMDACYPNLVYENSKNNFYILKNNRNKLKIRLVWTKKCYQNSELACWYGADPNYY